jgi:hypothetical protein
VESRNPCAVPIAYRKIRRRLMEARNSTTRFTRRIISGFWLNFNSENTPFKHDSAVQFI